MKFYESMLDDVRWLEIHLDTGQRTDTFRDVAYFQWLVMCMNTMSLGAGNGVIETYSANRTMYIIITYLFAPLVNRTANHPPNYGLKPCFLLRLQKYDFLKIEHRKSINILLFIILSSFSSGMILGLYIYTFRDIPKSHVGDIYIYFLDVRCIYCLFATYVQSSHAHCIIIFFDG